MHKVTDMSDMNDTQSDLLSFLGSETQADTSNDVQSHEVETQELDNEESHDEDHDTDGYDDDSDEDDSTADYDDEESEDDDGDDSDSTEVKATNIDDDEFEIEVDGEKLTVKGSELKSGYMRREAFTRKTQEVAQQRKALDAELTKAIERSEAVKFNSTIEMERLDGVLKQLGGWDGLKRQATPQEYEQFHAMYVNTQKDFNIAQDILNETVNTMKANNSKQIQSIFKDLASTRSDFNKDTMNELNTFLEKKGFTEDMVLSITDVAAWDMILDAMAYSKLQARTSETVKTNKEKEFKNKTHQSVPAKKTQQKSSAKRDFEKTLAKQKNARGAEQSVLTQDLLKRLLK